MKNIILLLILFPIIVLSQTSDSDTLYYDGTFNVQRGIGANSSGQGVGTWMVVPAIWNKAVLDSFAFRIRKIESPTGNLTPHVCTVSHKNVNTVLASGTARNVSDFTTDANGLFYSFIGLNYELSAGDSLYLTITSDWIDGTNFLYVKYSNNIDIGGFSAYDDGIWVYTDGDGLPLILYVTIPESGTIKHFPETPEDPQFPQW